MYFKSDTRWGVPLVPLHTRARMHTHACTHTHVRTHAHTHSATHVPLLLTEKGVYPVPPSLFRQWQPSGQRPDE
jgi:hypothetical protein